MVQHILVAIVVVVVAGRGGRRVSGRGANVQGGGLVGSRGALLVGEAGV